VALMQNLLVLAAAVLLATTVDAQSLWTSTRIGSQQWECAPTIDAPRISGHQTEAEAVERCEEWALANGAESFVTRHTGTRWEMTRALKRLLAGTEPEPASLALDADCVAALLPPAPGTSFGPCVIGLDIGVARWFLLTFDGSNAESAGWRISDSGVLSNDSPVPGQGRFTLEIDSGNGYVGTWPITWEIAP
jgi:hypothetical protein